MEKISRNRMLKIQRAVRVLARDQSLNGLTKAAKYVGEEIAKALLISVKMTDPNSKFMSPNQTDNRVRITLEGLRLLE